MASIIIVFANTVIIFILGRSKSACGCFSSIISFGDSLADTGNLLYLASTNHQVQNVGFPPYGETFFHHPTGRFSDGRLVIDFIAEELMLPLVPPWHGSSGRNFQKGVNFAVGGRTALKDSFFASRGVKIPTANVSLVAQLTWFKEFLSKICHTPEDCKRYLETSLILAGEIGGNDYNHAFVGGKTKEEVASYIPEVIQVIGLTIEELIKLGARTLVVPGNFPIGCSLHYRTFYGVDKERDIRDLDTGCIKWLNQFSKYHNTLLQMTLDHIRQVHPQATIIYADYYNVAKPLYFSPNKFGFTREGALRACCGGGGTFNMNLSVECGDSAATTCKNASEYVSWDDKHLTEAAYRWIAKGLMEVPYTTPHLITDNCASVFNSLGLSDQ